MSRPATPPIAISAAQGVRIDQSGPLARG